MQKLIQGIHQFRSEVFRSQQELFARLTKGQTPEALFITCSDSRVNPNLITQSGPGDLFTLRNAGNIVPPYVVGSSEAATIEFAVASLGVKDIIVCGHTLCGAMKGLLDPQLCDGAPAVRAWLDVAEPTRRLMQQSYGYLTGPALLTATIEENVLAQIDNLRTHPSVRERIDGGDIALYAWVYKIETGEVFQFDSERGQFLSLVGESAPVSAVSSSSRYPEAALAQPA